jgi:tetraacyldisaccharide 4'-kinase
MDKITRIAWHRTAWQWNLLLFPLTLLSWLYGAIVWLRLFFYRSGLFKTRRVACRVISIGNLTVGGTGKTPITLFLAEQHRLRGIAVGVVSRGYGRADRSAIVPVSDGKQLLATPERAGDEPYFIAERLREVPVVVAADRQAGCRWLIERCGVEVILLDDGFQHLALHRDLNILLCDARRPFGNGHLLPRGPLRESPSEAKRADIVILTRATEEVADPRLSTKTTLRCVFEPTALVHLTTGEICKIDTLAGQPLLAFCGIAQPDPFFDLLERAGAVVKKRRVFPDHHRYVTDDLIQLQKEAGTLRTVTTEKDAVKIRPICAENWGLWAVRIEAKLPDGWERLLF